MSRKVVFRLVLMLTICQFAMMLYEARVPIAEQSELKHRVEAKAGEWHNKCLARLQTLQLTKPTEALAAGLVLGDKSLMASDVKKDMRNAGMSHIMAVSGLHIGILWLVIMTVLSLSIPIVIRLGYNELIVHDLIRVVALLLLWLYVVVVGCPASALRAGLMITIIQISIFLHSNAWGWHNLVIAVVVMLVMNPELLFDVGFQLSVSATAGIIAFRPLLENDPMSYYYSATKRFLQYLTKLLVLTFSAQLFAIPFVAYYFHYVPVLGWVQGVFVVPLVSVVIAGFLFLLLLPSEMLLVCVGDHTLAFWLSWPLERLSDWIHFFASTIGRFESWLMGGRVEWHPSAWEAVIMEVFFVAAVVCWRIGHSKTT